MSTFHGSEPFLLPYFAFSLFNIHEIANSSLNNNTSPVINNNNSTTNSTQLTPYVRNQSIVSLTIDGITFPVFSFLVCFKLFRLFMRWKSLVQNNKYLQTLIIPLSALQILASASGIATATAKLVEARQVVPQVLLMINYECIVITAGLCFLSQCLTTKVLYEIYYNPKRLWMQNGEFEKTKNHQTAIRIYSIVAGVATVGLLSLLVPAILISLTVPYYGENNPSFDVESAVRASLYIFYASIAISGLIMIFSCISGVINFYLTNILTKQLLNDEMGKVTSKRKKAQRTIMIAISLQTFLNLLVNIVVILASVSVFVDYYMFIFAYGIQRVVVFLFTFGVRFIYGPLDELEGNISKDINVKEGQDCWEKFMAALCCCCCGGETNNSGGKKPSHDANTLQTSNELKDVK
ncbi:hypothetical protein C9374_014057 [Naegleria lovaniensis]|uniref:Uncharacterized protein n=1 Tax=Naegleria lovaniensis TaxID=51637 RepID=A0AA88GV68_NAELO|nr:uncharacterized protein C9374_014057 [Naegleria lovaniensis]KAG2389497.1 hypothetical protein C9374_014057 [Naegleria lovaniensis]